MRTGLAKIMGTVRTSRYFESPETDLHIAQNACCIDYTDIWSSKRVHWLLKSYSPHWATSDFGCKDTLQLYSGVTQTILLIIGIHKWVATNSKQQWLPATFHYTGQMDHCQVCHGGLKAIAILDTVDVEEVYSPTESRYHSIEWYVRSHGWLNASFG